MVRSIWDEDRESEEEQTEPEESFWSDTPEDEVEAEGDESGEDDESAEEEEEAEAVDEEAEDSPGEDGVESEEETFVDDRGGFDDDTDEDDGINWESFQAEFSSGLDDDYWVEKPPPPIPVLGEAIFLAQNACRAYSLLVNLADKGLKLGYRYIKGKITDYMEDPYGEEEEEDDEEENQDEYPRL